MICYILNNMYKKWILYILLIYMDTFIILKVLNMCYSPKLELHMDIYDLYTNDLWDNLLLTCDERAACRGFPQMSLSRGRVLSPKAQIRRSHTYASFC